MSQVRVMRRSVGIASMVISMPIIVRVGLHHRIRVVRIPMIVDLGCAVRVRVVHVTLSGGNSSVIRRPVTRLCMLRHLCGHVTRLWVLSQLRST